MFLKRLHRKKNGKEHVYWALVESHRTARGPRHRVVSYLGELSSGERRGWARLGTALDGKAESKARQLSLFDTTPVSMSEAVPEVVEVRLRGVQVRRTRDFGEVFLGLMVWKMLGLEEELRKHVGESEGAMCWPELACILSIARLTHPSSELHTADVWYGGTALPDMLGISEAGVYHTRLYRTLDKILPLKGHIERHLKARFGELFQPDFEILLYDVTSTYFEGEARKNPKAQRGYSRDHRPDCKQVCIALVVTCEGFPLGYEVFAGNRTDVTSVEEMVECIEKKYGESSRIWVMDRGMVSEENLEFLRKRNGRYLVGTPKSMLRKYEKELVGTGWSEVQEGLQVKLVSSPGGGEVYVLCRSAARAEKEKAMHQRFLDRIEAGLKRLESHLEKSKEVCDREAVGRQIGRLLQANHRAAKAFHIEVKEDCTRASRLRLQWSRRKEWEEWASLSEGCYLLRTNLTGLSPQELWRTYMQLTDIEEVFRVEKSDLKIRPIWHQLETRVDGHILFSFLAYALWKTIQTWMERSGLGRGVRTVLGIFSELKACDVYLPTTGGRELKICCITAPNKAQRAIIDRLGIETPNRLGRPIWVPKPEQTQTEM